MREWPTEPPLSTRPGCQGVPAMAACPTNCLKRSCAGQSQQTRTARGFPLAHGAPDVCRTSC
eukprot:2658783-Alexandrium_andersonii.AAC.1